LKSGSFSYNIIKNEFKMVKNRFLKGNSILLLNMNIMGHFDSLMIFNIVTVYIYIFNLFFLIMVVDYKIFHIDVSQQNH
ncbi:hypothetical protein ACFCVU_18010, partial [Peribacillus butanolivorans]|uniref:hypothetical protein n=1 Tax=Peribacillus butanolivorans TaxID=421767 RepID=UPI0035D8E13B